MSAEKDDMPPSPSSPYNDAEKGILEALPQADVKTLALEPKLPTLAKHTPPIKPAGKPKKRVSRWILWRIWFNTYRYEPRTLHGTSD